MPAFYQEAVAPVAALPGVDQVALAGTRTMDGSNSQTTVQIADGRSPISTSPDINVVGPAISRCSTYPSHRDGSSPPPIARSSLPVVVVNETMAREFWNGDAIGKPLTDEGSGEHLQIVGVVRDVRHRSFDEAPRPMMYFSADQRTRPRMTLHVRTTVPPAVIGPALQRALREIDRTARLTPAETMTEYLDRVTGCSGSGPPL